MNPMKGDLLKHRIGGEIYKVINLLQIVDTPEVYLWRGFLQNITTGVPFPYSLHREDYWDKFWEFISPSKQRFEVGGLYGSTKSGNIWQVIEIHPTGALRAVSYNKLTKTSGTWITTLSHTFAQNFLVPFICQEEVSMEEELFV